MNISEEIFLQSDEYDVNEGMPEKLDKKSIYAKLVQINKFKNLARRVAIFADHFLYVKTRSLLNEQEYIMDLNWLTPEPRSTLHIPWKWLYSTVALIVMTLLYYTTAFYFELYSMSLESRSIILVLLSSLLLFTAFVTYYFTYYFHTFLSRWGDVEVLKLIPNTPDRTQYKKFIKKLQKKIEETQDGQLGDKTKLLAQAVQNHRHLKERGVITESQYQQAKQRILANH